MWVPPIQSDAVARTDDDERQGGEVPKEVVDRMAAVGATMSSLAEGDLSLVEVRHGDPAWDEYEAWWLTRYVGGTMLVCASFRPSPEYHLCPSPEVGVHITWEANSVVYHCASLTLDDLADGPMAIPGPIAETLVLEKMRDPRVALGPLIDCLRNPPDGYELLRGLSPGSYICDLQHIWSGTVVIAAVFK
ncbi:hypothetical protein DYB25_004226 [Aphanomyces astaci]|uniref:Uncharacterized protein n=2 Tax=Aphanomyces astaci TaxID=112090 RepID=A0A397FDR2_APHAT|nr:hypothetical protein DYB25_004226 [Aphanomyces astaci]RHY65245.1 hypothetical protein DYB38_004332 [Aphanomyces astaci]RHZ16806.1 hypothetical protein DYB31_000593 [Aphanomyces astaci]